MTDYETKDSGKREEMPTGSVRDSRAGKGRFELISPFALTRIAGVYERGAAKYAARNWEKGQPFSRFLDSALRHLNCFAKGWTDEDHVSQAAWNLLAILHFQETGRADLDDMPHYQCGPAPLPPEDTIGDAPWDAMWREKVRKLSEMRG